MSFISQVLLVLAKHRVSINGNRHADGRAGAAGFNLKLATKKSHPLLHARDADARPKRGATGFGHLPAGTSWTLIADFQLNFIRASI